MITGFTCGFVKLKEGKRNVTIIVVRPENKTTTNKQTQRCVNLSGFSSRISIPYHGGTWKLQGGEGSYSYKFQKGCGVRTRYNFLGFSE